MGVHIANQTSFKKGQRAKNWNGFIKGRLAWNKGLKGINAGEKSSGWKGGLPNCKTCGTQLSQRHSKTNLCRKCFSLSNIMNAISYLPKSVKGDKNPNWKGGLTNKDKMQRVKFRKTIQKEVLKRDNYTCQLCGVRGKDMHVDHIQSWAEYVELRFKMENCRTLCASCHYEITFGKPMPKMIKAWGHNMLKGGY